MQELKQCDLSRVAGSDGFDVASGGLTGASIGGTAVGVTVALGVTVTAPVTLGAIAVGASIGALYSYFTND